MTEAIFLSVLLFAIGRGLAWCFRKLNPFFMICGFIVLGLPLAGAYQSGEWYQVLAASLGIASYFIVPLGQVLNFLNPISAIRSWRYNKSLERENYSQSSNSSSRNYYSENTSSNDYQDDIARAKEQAQREYEEHTRHTARKAQQKAQSEYDKYSEEREAAFQARMRKAEADLKRREEELKRNQQQQSNTQEQAKQKTQSEQKGLDPTKLKDAYEILGMKEGISKAEAKKVLRRLRSMYSPDKVNNLGESRRLQAEEEMKMINAAWDAVKRNFKQ